MGSYLRGTDWPCFDFVLQSYNMFYVYFYHSGIIPVRGALSLISSFQGEQIRVTMLAQSRFLASLANDCNSFLDKLS